MLCYNVVLLVVLLWLGMLVIHLFLVALPIVLMLHVAAPLTSIFAPHVLWIPITLSLIIYFFGWRYFGPADTRPHNISGSFWDLSVLGSFKRLAIFLLLPLLVAASTHWVMRRGCYPCTSTAGFAPGVPPSKPILMAHRGCGFDFPENTIAAYEMAEKIPSVEGFETDIYVSADGVPFLLHDPFLVRTTDVRERCPQMKPRKNASLLNYHNGSCPIRTINAGKKFVNSKKDELSDNDREQFLFQKVPTFRKFLQVTRDSRKFLIFDLGELPVDHPYYESYVNITLQEIRGAGIPLNKVMIVTFI